MTWFLLLATSLWGQSISTAPAGNYQFSRLDALELLLRDYTVGRSTFTGLPTFQNGIKFNDGTVQVSSVSGNVITSASNTLTGYNTFSNSSTTLAGHLNFSGRAGNTAAVDGWAGLTIMAKNLSGTATVSSGCVVVIDMSSSADGATAVFTSTTTDLVARAIGVTTQDTCAANQICPVMIAGIARHQCRSTLSQGNKIGTFTTACQADAGGTGGVIMQIEGSWCWSMIGSLGP